ncbi:Saccharopine dehydrogenase-domain-containing protein [Hypoxylon crocopeplum]|nr:Saccharopine dehydrogenase-domain-containing protein [Hypoxylon crocopeplum]
MSSRKHDRQYDLVLLGATGYTGAMTAEQITAHLPTDLKWAVAGRSADKLKNVTEECKPINPDRTQPDIMVVDLNDTGLRALAKKTFILITTVGPYERYGEHAVKACAGEGTHYIDCTSETPWVSRIIKDYHDKARATGAIMVPQCGIDSAPSDLLTWALAQRIKSELSVQVGDVIIDLHELQSQPSGGTIASMLGLFDNFTLNEFLEILRPYALSPVQNSHRGPKSSIWSKLTGLYSFPNLGLLGNSINATFNSAIVWRTWGLLQTEDSLRGQSYGPKFSYQEFMKVKSYLAGIVLHYVMIMGGFLLLIPPFRSLIRRLVYVPGDGPDKDAAKKEYSEFRGTANPDPQQESSQQAFGRVYYTGSMYGMTAVFLAQAASTILRETIELKGGIYTPACLGQKYIDHLNDAGLKVETQMMK